MSGIFPVFAFLFGVLGQDLRHADPNTIWAMYLLSSFAVWLITGITWLITKITRWVKYGTR
jgi:biotin transporter BioY